MIHPKHIPEKCCQNALTRYLFIERFLLCGAHKLLCHFHGNHELLMRKPITLGSHEKIKSNLEQCYRTDVRTFSGDEWFRGLFLFCLCTFIFTSSQVLVGLAPESKGTYTGSLAWGLATDSRHNRLEICLWFICWDWDYLPSMFHPHWVPALILTLPLSSQWVTWHSTSQWSFMIYFLPLNWVFSSIFLKLFLPSGSELPS